ncbi:MAG TPA: PH domain-containing protein [Wenzhouxiangellaceae bacterium]|nr:PH domain-containing protein [Wenzhouxiangellaceae bacterium]
MTEVGAFWKALPISAVGALYINGVQRFVRENLIVFFGAGTGFAVSDSLGWREFGLGAGLVLLTGLLVALIYHRRFRYRVDEDSLRVRKGLFEQQELKVRFERVQNVGFSQPIYLRPLGLVRVTLETPGAAQTEVSLPGIASEEARTLRDMISGAVGRQTGAADSQDAESGRHERQTGPPAAFSASAADLFKYGMTSNQIWILLAIFGAPASNWVESRVSSWVEQLSASGLLDMELLRGAPLLLALLVGLLIVSFALLLMALSGLLAIVRFHDYRLLRETDRFKSRFGLLDVREKSLKLTKLHAIEIVQTAVGRLLGQWHAIGHQAGAAQLDQAMNDDRRFLIPGIDGDRLEEVVRTLRGGVWDAPDWEGIHPRFRSMLWSRISLMLVASALIVWFMLPAHLVWPTLVILGLNLLILGIVHLHWRRWGYAIDGQRMRIRSGLIGQKIVEFDLARCQQAGIRISPYQRRHKLASLSIRLPHGEQSIPYLPQAVADQILNILLYRTESSAEDGL